MGTHPIFESDFDCLTDCVIKKTFCSHGYDGASYRSCQDLHEGCDSFCSKIYQARPKRISKNCLCNSNLKIYMKDAIRFVRRSTKPDRKEFQKIAFATAIC